MRLFTGNRTRIFAFVVGVAGILEAYNAEIVRQLVPPEFQGLSLCAIAIGIFVLRQITTTPPGVKE